jgi:beta-glucosidase
MTLAEKAGQLSQLACPGDPSSEILAAIRAGRLGSILNAADRDQRNELQRIAVEESHLGIPLVFGRDVLHGFRTILPIPLAQAATFDPDLAERGAAVAAAESREAGIDWVFAPMVDVARDPRWGRVAEGCGEDPLLTSRMGAAMVRGFQGSGPGESGRVAACAKHFVGYGAAEAGKEYNTTWIPEALLREVYLKPFRACVEAGVATLMSAFNDLNGIPASGTELTLRDILRGEWGFTGFVVSDWASIREMIVHGACDNDSDAAGLALTAGVDMDMEGRCYAERLPALVEAGRLPVAFLDEAVRRVLRMKHRLDLFERPYAPEPKVSVTLSENHRAVARQLVHESLVLLKNEGVLPFGSKLRSLAIVGPLADAPHEQLGSWAFDGREADAVSVRAALEARARAGGGELDLHFAPGLDSARSTDKRGFGAALRAARRSDMTLAVVGENANLSGECRSRAFLDLPGAQLALLEKLAATGRPLVVVVMAGRPLVIGRLCELASAVVYAWHPGTMGGPGIVDVLFGDVAPSGKLPISFPRAVGQIPIYYASKNTGRPPSVAFRGIPTGTPLDPVGFEASYLDVEVTPQFPFGFGLSYTTFEHDGLELRPTKARVGESVSVRSRVKNTGSVSGVETVQLYVRDRVASVTRPVRELKAFRRVALAPNESAVVDFVLAPEDLSFCGADMEQTIEPGWFDIWVGDDSGATLGAELELVGNASADPPAA